MHFKGDAFLKPALKLGIGGHQLIAKNAGRGAPINLLKPLENGPQVSFVFWRFAQVINRDDYGGIDARLSDPLRCCKSRQPGMGIKRIVVVKVSEPVGGMLGRTKGRRKKDQGEDEESSADHGGK